MPVSLEVLVHAISFPQKNNELGHGDAKMEGLGVRLSGQIYLELDDFRWLGEILRKICANPGAILG